MSIIPNPEANFTPPLKGYSGQGAFRFWCQTVLPLVYDDSLSYYELLNKVVNYLNNTISDVANMEDNVQGLHDAYISLQNYVNEYFSTLDVQQEIDAKLDEMASDGTLSALINPLLPDMIADWLSEHITPTTPVVDNTLSIAGAAADAKTVGDNMMYPKSVDRYAVDGVLDLDDIREQGHYVIPNQYTLVNAPTGFRPQALFVERTQGGTVERFVRQYAYNFQGMHHHFYIRYSRLSGNWVDWDAFDPTENVIKKTVNGLTNAVNYDFTTPEKSHWVISANGTWLYSDTAESLSIPRDGTQMITVTGKANQTSVVAFLKTRNPVSGETPDFSDEYPERITIEDGKTVTYFVPNDAQYLYFSTKNTSGVDTDPTLVINYFKTDTTLTETNVPADAEAVGAEITNLESEIGTLQNEDETIRGQISTLQEELNTGLITSEYDFSSVPKSGWIINAENMWRYPGEAKSYTVPVNSIKKITVSGSTNGTSIVAFLRTNEPVSGETPDFSTSQSSRITVSSAQTNTYVVPNDTKYLYFSANDSAGIDTTPNVIAYYTLTDTTLTQSHVPADAKAVGEALNAVGEAKIVSHTNENVWEYMIAKESKFPVYLKNNDTIIVSDEEIYGTGYIACPKYLCLSFNDNTARVLVYFYDYDTTSNTYTPRWDLLDLTATTNVKNNMSIYNSENRVITVPDGVYMRLCKYVDGDVKIYGWNGNHFGCELAITPYAPTSAEPYTDDQFNVKRGGLTIPGDAKLIVMKKGAMSALWGIKADNSKTLLFSGKYFQTYDLPSGYQYFRASIGLDYYAPYNLSHGTLSNLVYCSDYNDFCGVATEFTSQRPQSRGLLVIDNMKLLANIEWKCVRGGIPVANQDKEFGYNTVYRGVPYASDWTRACYIGWHITKHTFINAANDSRSYFYANRGRNGGPGYGQVCSTSACLAAGWPYPVITRCFELDPECSVYKRNQPQIGEIMWNGGGHCLVIDSIGHGANYNQWSIYEGLTPFVLRKATTNAGNPAGGARQYSYLYPYMYEVHHNGESNTMQGYDVVNGSLTNGSARPYKGDRGVFTSDENVQINIKNNATTLYYQTATYNASTDSFTLTGTRQSQSISGTVPYSVNMNKSTLTDGSIYAVWTDTDDTKEYFEYHVAPVVTYTASNDNFTFNVPSNVFYYACWWQTSTEEGITEVVPYRADGDYTGYRKVYNPQGSQGYMCFKGTLGAYMVDMPAS